MIFIACSTCFGHHYAHHQELKSIVQMVATCGIWFFGFQVVGMALTWGLCVRFAGLKIKAPNTTGSNLELLMMGIMVPETCWSSNNICNKNHLLHLVGILLPHIWNYTSVDNFCDSLSQTALAVSSLGSFTANCRVRYLVAKFIQYVADAKPSFTERAVIGLMDKLIDWRNYE